MTTEIRLARVAAFVGIAVISLATPVLGQECPEWVNQELVGYSYWKGFPKQIEVSGSHVFLGPPYGPPGGCKGGGYTPVPIAITDISDPEGPRIVGEVVDSVMDFVVSGNRLIHLSRRCRETWHGEYLNITDVSDPANPTPLLSGHQVDAYPWAAIATIGDTVYVATVDGLSVLDVTDSANPVEVGFLTSQWEGVSDLVAEPGFVYAAMPGQGLRIINVTDPAQPEEIGLWESAWEARDLEVADGFAYVADGASGLRVIDVTEPTVPAEVGVLETADEASWVSVAGTIATVALGDSGVLIVDVSNPSSPESVSLFETGGPAVGAALSGNTAYVSDGGNFEELSYPRFWVVDVTVPASPMARGGFGYLSTATDVAVADGLHYVALGDNGLAIVDHGHVDTPGFALGVTPYRDLALVADDHKGLRIIDVSDPANMAEVGFIDTPGRASSVDVADDYAYVADGDGGLRVVDISAPSHPIEVAVIDTLEPALDVSVWGDYAYVAVGYDFRVIDISDPLHPFDLLITEPICATAVEAADGRLLVGCGGWLMTFGSLAQWIPPWNRPSPLSKEWIYADVKDIKLSGQHAYIATQDRNEPAGGVQIFDVLNLHHPSIIGEWTGDLHGQLPFDGEVWAVAVSGDHIYLATGLWGVQGLDAGCLTTYWLGVVAHNNGTAGSRWRSDVFISHGAAHGVNVDFVLHTRHGEIAAETYIGPTSQGVFEDFVGLLGYEGKGSLEIHAGVPIDISSRIYNETDSGDFGAYFPGYRSSDCLKHGERVGFYGLCQLLGECRTNITVTNTGTEPGSVYVTLHRSDGEELTGYVVDVDPGMVVQDLQPFKNRAGQPDLGWGFAKVRVRSAPMLVSATVIDARTNDAMMVPMSR